MNGLARFRILVEMGLRNLVVHRIKSLVVGALMFFGTFLVVLGTALLDSVAASMERSITSSLSGNAQVYAADARDELSLFPAGSSGTSDYGEIDDFPAVREVLLGVDNVADVVPMGITNALVFGTPELDRVVGELGDAVDRGDTHAAEVYAAHVRAIAASLRRDVLVAAPVATDPEAVRRDLAALDEVLGEPFWAGFESDPGPALGFLDTRVAPLAMDGRLLYFRLLGTDLDQYASGFSSFQIVHGSLPPPGEPGLLIADRFYERQVKTKTARDLDALWTARQEGRLLADDPVLALTAERLPRQVQQVLVQLAPADAADVLERLSADLGPQDDLKAALEALLTVSDDTLPRHHALFYEVVAPRIRLYETPVGSEVVLRSFTKAGYQRAVALKVWGTFTFTGLEGSDLAGTTSLVDLGSFRKLYGRMTAEQQAELSGIRDEIGLREVSRQDAESALFGGGPSPSPSPSPSPDVVADGSDDEFALNAAVLFEDRTRAAETIAAIQGALDREGLGLEVVGWQQASGIVGQLLIVMRAVLTIAVLVIFLVTLVIINNTMVMATMERTGEIGTMRAIGAPRRFVIALFVVETIVLGVIAGGLGAAAAVGLVTWLGQVGVPAAADILVLLFAGKHLYPAVGTSHVVIGLASIVGISLLSALYPALLAARVPPVVAMRGQEAS